MFDQVLIRPDLVPVLKNDIIVLSKIGNTELLTKNGIPRRGDDFSDHLPITFKLDLD